MARSGHSHQHDPQHDHTHLRDELHVGLLALVCCCSPALDRLVENAVSLPMPASCCLSPHDRDTHEENHAWSQILCRALICAGWQTASTRPFMCMTPQSYKRELTPSGPSRPRRACRRAML